MCVRDEKKRLSNLEKHGFDFRYAYIVYNDLRKATELTRRNKEERRADIAFIEPFGFCLTLVYAYRGSDIRIISFRKSSKKEKSLFAVSRQIKLTGPACLQTPILTLQ